MKRGASFISTFLLSTIALAFIIFLANPQYQNTNWLNQQLDTTNLLNGVFGFFTNPANWALIGISAGLAFVGGVNFIATLVPLITSLIATQTVYNALFNSMFTGLDSITLGFKFVLQASVGVAIFIGVLIVFRGIIDG